MARQYHWWIATTIDGKPQLIYGAPDFGTNGGEDVAREKGLSMLSGYDFRMFRYPTMDKNAASAYHRGKKLEKGSGLREATRRLGHEKSIERLIRKQRARELRNNWY